MKRVFGNRLREEARKYSEMQNCIAYLEDTGKIGQMFELFYNICNNEKIQNS